jgi:hypothetical protein
VNVTAKAVDVAGKLNEAARKTAGSRASSGARNDDAGAASLLVIEQLFAHSACLRIGQAPEDLQQHDVRAAAEISAIDGSVIAAMRNAAKNRSKAASIDSRKPPGRETPYSRLS